MDTRWAIPAILVGTLLASPALTEPRGGGKVLEQLVLDARRSGGKRDLSKYITWSVPISGTSSGESDTQETLAEDNSSMLPKTSDEGSPLPEAYSFNKEDLRQYQLWIKQTIRESKRMRRPAIIVDKASYSLDLYDNGRLMHTFPIELGCDPVSDKLVEGDCATPEGRYRISWVRDIGQTTFYRALLIDYPRLQDWREFRAAKKAGIIEPDDKIGGLVEIHGHGSGHAGNNGGHNWTLGCIALSNEHMDTIFEHARTQMPVTIVKYGTKM